MDLFHYLFVMIEADLPGKLFRKKSTDILLVFNGKESVPVGFGKIILC